MWAMPTTTVVNTIGAIIIFTSLMNPSPSGRMAAACSGERKPKRTPIAIATSTCRYRLENIRLLVMRVTVIIEDTRSRSSYPMTLFRASLIVAACGVAALALVLFKAPSGPRSLRAFDPDRLANLEVDMWQAYYRKQ